MKCTGLILNPPYNLHELTGDHMVENTIVGKELIMNSFMQSYVRMPSNVAQALHSRRIKLL